MVGCGCQCLIFGAVCSLGVIYDTWTVVILNLSDTSTPLPFQTGNFLLNLDVGSSRQELDPQ